MDFPTVEAVKFIFENGENITVGLIAVVLAFLMFYLIRSSRQNIKEQAVSELKLIEERRSFLELFKDQSAHSQANVTALQEVALSLRAFNSNLLAIPQQTSDLIEVLLKRELKAIADNIHELVQAGGSLQIGVIIIAPDGRVTFANREIAAILGITIKAIYELDFKEMGIVLYDLDTYTAIPSSETPISLALSEKVSSANKVFCYRNPLTHKIVWLVSHTTANISPEGQLKSVVSTFYDIGEIINLSEKMPVM